MATIQQAMTMQDKMTPVFNKMMKAMTSTLGVMKNLDMQSNKGMNAKMFEEAEKDIQAANNELIKFDNNLKSTKQQLGEGNGSGMFDVFKGSMMSNYASRAVDGLVNTITSGIETASDLMESQNVVDVTFGADSTQINEFAKNATEQFGISELSAKQYAGTMGALLKSSGMTGEGVTTKAMDMTGLAADMASFYNLDPGEAFTKIRSGISGETEPLKQLGINMSVANLEAYALSQGIRESYASMDQANQVSLRYNYLMNVTKDAQGDFMRTGDGFANQQRKLTENWKSFTAVMAENVVPVLAVLMGGMNALISFMRDNWSWMSIILIGIAVVIGVVLVQAMWSAAKEAVVTGLITAKAWIVAHWPLLLIVAAIVAVIIAFQQMGISVADVAGFVAGIFAFLAAGIMNGFIGVQNYLGAFVVFIKNCFTDPVAAVQMLFYDLCLNVLKYFDSMTSGISDFFSLFGLDIGGTLDGWIGDLESRKADIAVKANLETFNPQEFVDSATLMAEWSTNTKDFVNGFSGLDIGGMMPDTMTLDGGTLDSVGKIKGDVKITDEDIKLLKSIATTKFVNQYTTLRPNMKVEFNGPISKDVDVDEIITKIENKLEETSNNSVMEEAYA